MEMTYASRHILLVGIILMDIDNFKQVNDTYGHPCGDTILAQFANIIIENKRTEDIFARFGGEEFIILPRGEINREDMQGQCERIRKAVKKFTFRCDDACFQLTVSLGFHITKASGSDVDSMLKNLIRKADQALYLAKENGRDRIENLLKYSLSYLLTSAFR
jgi:diguanylate cyclase (GGDEF)-like protein